MTNSRHNTVRAESGVFDGARWRIVAGGRFLVHAGPALETDLDRRQVKDFVRSYHAWGAMWSYDPSCESSPWYRLICDIPDYNMENGPGKSARKCIRRCLRVCEVRHVDYPWLAEHGYDVYRKATDRYRGFVPTSRQAFRTDMLRHTAEPGREAMGVFHDGRLIAYATLRVQGPVVSVLASKFDPHRAKEYPMYGLHFAIAEHYLGQRGLWQVDSGTRALLHETDISDFLIRLGWRRQFCRLGFYLVPHVHLSLCLLCRIRGFVLPILPGRFRRLLSVLMMARTIAKATASHIVTGTVGASAGQAP